MSILETLTTLRVVPEFMRNVTAWERAPAHRRLSGSAASRSD